EAGALPVKTKMPSEVAGSESGLGYCRLNPFVRFAVTIPGTFPNVCPRRGETWAAPWISWMNVGGGGGASVVKLNAKFPSMLFGGSPVQKWSGDVVLRGAGASASKSVELLSLSVQPASFWKAAVAFESVGAAALSKKFAPS